MEAPAPEQSQRSQTFVRHVGLGSVRVHSAPVRDETTVVPSPRISPVMRCAISPKYRRSGLPAHESDTGAVRRQRRVLCYAAASCLSQFASCDRCSPLPCRTMVGLSAAPLPESFGSSGHRRHRNPFARGRSLNDVVGVPMQWFPILAGLEFAAATGLMAGTAWHRGGRRCGAVLRGRNRCSRAGESLQKERGRPWRC
jgi:hypothetical protein